MTRKIIYLMQPPLSAREFSTFGLEHYLSLGLEVEVWECSSFLSKSSSTPSRLQNFSAFREMNSAAEVCAAIAKEAAPDIAVINLLPKNFTTLPIFAALNSSSAQSVEVRTNAIPLGPGRFIKKIKKITPKQLFNFFLRRPGFWQKQAGKPKFIIYGGEICRPNPNEAKYLISAHALDYDAFIDFCKQYDRADAAGAAGHCSTSPKGPTSAKQPMIAGAPTAPVRPGQPPCLPAPKKQIVFLDQNFPFHSDFAVLGRKPPVTAEKYYPSLCRFFDELEKILNMPVIIAVHPRAPSGNGNDFWGGRSLIKGQTLPLVCESSLVLAHTSTAINFAVMAQRPVLLMSTNELEKEEAATIRLIANNLGAATINIDNLQVGWSQNLLDINTTAYKTYFSKYIKEELSPEKPFWQILIENLRA